MKTITNEELEEIYQSVYGFSVLEGERGETLKSVVLYNTSWFEDWIHDCEQAVWKELKKRGYDTINDEVKIA